MNGIDEKELPIRVTALEKGAEFRIFDVKEIRILHTAADVNLYLENGWTLFRVFTESSFIVVRI